MCLSVSGNSSSLPHRCVCLWLLRCWCCVTFNPEKCMKPFEQGTFSRVSSMTRPWPDSRIGNHTWHSWGCATSRWLSSASSSLSSKRHSNKKEIDVISFWLYLCISINIFDKTPQRKLPTPVLNRFFIFLSLKFRKASKHNSGPKMHWASILNTVWIAFKHFTNQ